MIHKSQKQLAKELAARRAKPRRDCRARMLTPINELEKNDGTSSYGGGVRAAAAPPVSSAGGCSGGT